MIKINVKQLGKITTFFCF